MAPWRDVEFMIDGAVVPFLPSLCRRLGESDGAFKARSCLTLALPGGSRYWRRRVVSNLHRANVRKGR